MRLNLMLVSVVICALALLPGSVVAADCSDGGTATCVVAAPDPAAALALDPSHGRADTVVGGSEWIAQSWQLVPFSYSSADTSYSVRSSISHLTTYAQYEYALQVLDNVPSDLRDQAIPFLVRPVEPKFDVWSLVNVSQSPASLAETRQDVLGADLKLARDAVVGIVVERDERVDGQEAQFAGYFKANLWDGIMVDTRAGWSEDTALLEDSAFSTAHTFVATKFAKNWKLGSYTFAPSIGIAVSSARSEADPENWQSGNVLSFEQRVTRTIDLEDQTAIAPYISFKHTLDSGVTSATDGDGSGVTTSEALGAGFTLNSATRYNLSVATSVARSESQDKPSIDGRVQLKLPLN